MLHPLVVVGLLGLVTGCVSGPESKSGDDAFRHQAAPMELDVWAVDSVTAVDGDRTDWKSFTIPVGADVVVTVVFDRDETEAEAGLYDRYGMPVASDIKKESDGPRLVLRGAVPAGMNFVRVTAAPQRKAGYSLEVKVAETHYPPPPAE